MALIVKKLFNGRNTLDHIVLPPPPKTKKNMSCPCQLYGNTIKFKNQIKLGIKLGSCSVSIYF